MSGYLDACLQVLASRPGVRLQLFHLPVHEAAPYDHSRFGSPGERHELQPPVSSRPILDALRTFRPQLVLVSSWNIAAFRQVARRLRGRVPRVMCMDNQWLATPKQLAGVALSPVMIRPLFDGVFVPGEPQARFARRLGFTESRTWRGLYSCDHDRFAAARRSAQPPGERRAFVFAGRLMEEKGVDVLVRAYQRYRRDAGEDPWELHVYGTGPLGRLVDGSTGVSLHGFVQPERLPAVLAGAGGFVLPSRFEPWGVVIHEAAAAGVPLVASTACGAAVHLLQDLHNGFLVDPDDVPGLAGAMGRLARLPVEQRQRYGERSALLAQQFTPDRWADAVQDMWGATRRG